MTRNPDPDVLTASRPRCPRAVDADLLDLAVLAATAYLEARAGHRDAAQLADFVDRRTARLLSAMVRRQRRHRPVSGVIRLRRVHLDRRPTRRPNLVVVLAVGDQVVPVCVQLQRVDESWTVITLTTPDDRPERGGEALLRPDWEEPASVEPW